MTSPDVSSPPPQREGIGRIVIIGIVLGLVITPIVVYFALDALSHFGPACSDVGGGEDRISCAMRPLVFTATSIPFGGLIGFFGGYWLACRRFNAGR